MNENILFNIGGLCVTKYGLLVMVGALCGSALAVVVSRIQKRISTDAVLSCAILALPLGLAFSRLTYCLVNYYSYIVEEGGLWRIFQLWEGGHSMSGVIVGVCLAVWITARRHGIRTARLADCMAAGFALFVVFVRLADGAVGQGWGKITEAQWLWNTVFSVRDVYGNWRYRVWPMEIIAALSALAAALCSILYRRRWGGDGAVRVLALYSTLQVVFESMREDGVLAIDFLRVSQIFSMAVLILLFAAHAVPACKAGDGKATLFRLVLLLVGVGLATWMEFSVDGEGIMEAKYAVMLLGSGMALVAALLERRSWLELRAQMLRRRAARRRMARDIGVTAND